MGSNQTLASQLGLLQSQKTVLIPQATKPATSIFPATSILTSGPLVKPVARKESP